MQDRFEGCFLGLACGDALGMPTEFLDLPGIEAAFGPLGIQEIPDEGLFTDDTQMTIAVAEALCAAGREELDCLARRMADEFVRWANSPENDRGPGATCLAGCARLEEGVPWREAGLRDSKGCGANMRVAPVGLFYHGAPERLRTTARMSALLTHAHPTALAAAEATALCVAWAAQGLDPRTYVKRLAEAAQSCTWDAALESPWGDEDPLAMLRFGWVEVLVAAGRVPDALRDRPHDFCVRLGGGWVAEEALAGALFCVCLHPDDYTATVRRAANSAGDSDSIACIAGAISGALLGLDAIPARWRGRVEKSDRLHTLARRLHAQRPA